MIEFSPFCLDLPGQCVWEMLEGEPMRPVAMRPKAFAVLAYLVQNAGKVVAEEQLLEAVWPGVFVQPEAIKGRLFEVRAALGDDSKAPRFIETVPRRGYRFIAPLHVHSTTNTAVNLPPPPALVGRESLVAQMRLSLELADRGVPQIVFVTGEPGIGKSAVIAAFEREAVEHLVRPRIARAHCIEGFGGKEAYFPVLVALGKMCDGPDGPAVVNILATLAPTWLVQFPALLTRERRELLRQEILGATRERMLREIRAVLEALTANRPMLMIFEDLQWVDLATIDLLSALARQEGELRLMIVASVRSGDIAQPGHPLQAVQQNLVMRRTYLQIDVAPLDAKQTAAYFETLLPQQPAPLELATLIHRHTGGNPLFMVAAVDNLMMRGLISKDDGRWVLNRAIDQIVIDVPDTLRKMIETQIQALRADQRAALEAASVVGAAFTVRVAATALDSDPGTFDDLCHSVAKDLKLLRFLEFQTFPDGDMSERYEFVHALYRDVLYRSLTPRRKMLMHRRVATCLEEAYQRQVGEIASEISLHLEECADWPKVVAYLGLSADMAERRLAPREAAKFLERAFELVDRLPPQTQLTQRVGLLERLAENYTLTYDDRLLATYRLLSTAAEQSGRLDIQLRVLRESVEHLSGKDAQSALDTLERLRHSSSSDPDMLLRAEVEMQCSVWPILAGHWRDEYVEGAKSALARIRSLASPAAVAPHLINYSYISLNNSDYVEAETLAVEGLSILSPDGRNPCSSFAHTFAAYVIYNAALFSGRWGRASQVANDTVETFVRNGHEDAAQIMRLRTVWLHLLAMDYKAATAICDFVATRLGKRIKPSHARLLLTLSGAAELGLGNLDSAAERLSAAAKQPAELTAHTAWRVALMLESATFELHFARGQLSEAAKHAAHFLRNALANPERTWRALAWEASLRVARAQSDPARALACLKEASKIIEGSQLPLSAWRVHASAAELYGDTSLHEEREQHLSECRKILSALADSIPQGHSLRSNFLRAPEVSRALGVTLSTIPPA